MIFSLLLVAVQFFPIQTSIYDITVSDGQGGGIVFNDFRGKKILIVNTASGSPYAAQSGTLEQLYQQYKDSLVVIAFPSNSFGHEPGTDSTIRAATQSSYNIHYLLAGKSVVSGAGQTALFGWLADASANGRISGSVTEDFQKFLIDENGNIVGVFAASVSPMDSVIRQAIETSYE